MYDTKHCEQKIIQVQLNICNREWKRISRFTFNYNLNSITLLQVT